MTLDFAEAELMGWELADLEAMFLSGLVCDYWVTRAEAALEGSSKVSKSFLIISPTVVHNAAVLITVAIQSFCVKSLHCVRGRPWVVWGPCSF